MDLLETVFAQVLANIVTIIIGAVLYWNFLLFKDYIWTVLWAFVISQALLSGKKRLVCLLQLLCDEQDKDKKMIILAWEHLQQYMTRMKVRSDGIGALFWWLALDNAMLVFAIVGWFTLLCHLVPWYALIGSFLLFCVVPTLLFLHIVDRKVFLYRTVISDELLAASIMVTLFFSSLAFVSIFLGAESFLEGMEAVESASQWVQSTLDDGQNQETWNSFMKNGKELFHTGFVRLRDTYGNTVWWSLVQMMHDKYSELEDVHDFWDLGMQGWLIPLQALLTDMYNMDGVSEFFHGIFDGKSLMRAVLNVLNFFAVALGFLFSMGFKALLFFTCLFYMLTQFNVLEKVVQDLLPVAEDKKENIKMRLQREIEGAFFIPTKIACFRGLVSLACFNLLNMEFCFFASFLSFLITLFPFVNGWLVCLPWVVGCWAMGSYIRGTLLLAIIYSAFSIADTKVYSQSLRHNPYITSLSYFMGFYVFGMKGVLLGPLTVCMGFFIYSSLGYKERNKREHFTEPAIPHESSRTNLDESRTSTPESEEHAGSDSDKDSKSPLSRPHMLTRLDSRSNIRSYSMDAGIASNANGGKSYLQDSLESSIAFFSVLNKRLGSQRHSKELSSGVQGSEKIRFYVKLDSEDAPPVRFDMLRSTSFDELIEVMKATFKIQNIQGVYGSDGSQIVSVAYIDSLETLVLMPSASS